MVKIDLIIWDSKEMLRDRLKNTAQIIISLSAINGFYTFGNNWFIFTINLIMGLTMIPIFISYTKWKKLPPKNE